jgi:hypothetical protein
MHSGHKRPKRTTLHISLHNHNPLVALQSHSRKCALSIDAELSRYGASCGRKLLEGQLASCFVNGPYLERVGRDGLAGRVEGGDVEEVVEAGGSKEVVVVRLDERLH